MHGEGYEPSAKGTVTYLAATPGIDAALERARAAGGKILMPKTHSRQPGLDCPRRGLRGQPDRAPRDELRLVRRADRLFRIVQYLRGRRLTTAAFLAGRLGVSLRTRTATCATSPSPACRSRGRPAWVTA